MSQAQIVTERADRITPRKLRWLWPGRIPLGKVTIFAGLPGEAKSLATIYIGARVSTARKYPDSENPLPASEVLFVAGEDDADDAILPRLLAANADLSKIHIFAAVRVTGQEADRGLRLDVDIKGIKLFFDSHPNIRLIVIDPVSNHLGDVSMVDEQEVRGILGELKGIAAIHDVAIVGVMHLNKKEGLSAIHRVGGAGAFIGVARASWLFTRDPKEPTKRLMMPLKNNYARESSSLVYRLDETPVSIENDDVLTPYIEWVDEIDLDMDEIISAPKKPTQRADAKEFLEQILAPGPQDASAVYVAAKARGISERTLDRAKKELGVGSRKKGTDGWEWVLPNDQSKNASEGRVDSGTLGTLQPVSTRE